jgi:hypothetical protein
LLIGVPLANTVEAGEEVQIIVGRTSIRGFRATVIAKKATHDEVTPVGAQHLNEIIAQMGTVNR